LAARRAYSGDYSVVVVFRTLIDAEADLQQANKAPP
jgi:hypothetical protein